MWKPLMPATPIRDEKRAAAILRDWKRREGDAYDEARARAVMEEELAKPVWKNLAYQVAVGTQPHGNAPDGRPLNLVHLSIRRLDRKPVRDWRDLQRIKNQLLGAECEAIEIFPAESRLIDTANQYHLWGFDHPGVRIRAGWFGRREVEDEPSPDTGVVQRRLQPEAEGASC